MQPSKGKIGSTLVGAAPVTDPGFGVIPLEQGAFHLPTLFLQRCAGKTIVEEGGVADLVAGNGCSEQKGHVHDLCLVGSGPAWFYNSLCQSTRQFTVLVESWRQR